MSFSVEFNVGEYPPSTCCNLFSDAMILSFFNLLRSSFNINNEDKAVKVIVMWGVSYKESKWMEITLYKRPSSESSYDICYLLCIYPVNPSFRVLPQVIVITQNIHRCKWKQSQSHPILITGSIMMRQNTQVQAKIFCVHFTEWHFGETKNTIDTFLIA